MAHALEDARGLIRTVPQAHAVYQMVERLITMTNQKKRKKKRELDGSVGYSILAPAVVCIEMV